MSYNLDFDPRAWKEWQKLAPTIKEQFKKKIKTILDNPHIEANRLRELNNCYKIKLAASGYRLVYQVNDNIVTVSVISVGKREKLQVYKKASHRID